jgi:hypothetical protein
VTLALILRLGRVSNLPTVWTNVVAGVVLSGAPLALETIFLLIVAASLFYVGGMHLNDAFDREIDAKERPERPIPSGEIAASAVFASGFGMLAGGTAVALLAAQLSSTATAPVLASAAALASAIVAYNAAHKGVRIAPVMMGACRTLVYVLAAVTAGGSLGSTVLLPAFALLAYIAGLTYVAAQENLRQVKNMWPLALLATPLIAATAGGIGANAALLFIIAFVVWVFAAVARITGDGPKDVPGAVTRLIAGISLVDALAIAGTGSIEIACVASTGVIATRLFQKFIPGT